MITQAAINFNGKLWTGRRHGQIMQEIWKEFPLAYITQSMQGFICSEGRFWNRKDAGQIAFDAGQTKNLETNLNSEHLWEDL